MSDARRTAHLVDLDNRRPELSQRLFETLGEMQAVQPVAWSDASGGFWALLKHADIVAASSDWEAFTVTEGIMIPPTGKSMPVIPAELDPPRHGGFRKLVLPHFTPRALSPWHEDIRRIVADGLKPIVDQGRGDVVTDFARPVPVLIICLVLGIDSDWNRIHDLGEEFMAAFADTAHPERGKAAAHRLEAFLGEEIAARRGEPVTDLLGLFVNAEVDGAPITDTEALGLVQLLVVAGHGTTVDAIGTMVHRLIVEQGLRDRLVADRALVPRMIDECLRLHAPVWNMARTVRNPTQVRGVDLLPGEKVMLAFGAGNHDPEKFADPFTFDLDRAGLSQHLTFGSGRHRCLGEGLARLEMQTVLDVLLDELSPLELDGDVVWGGHTNSHGLRSLPVRLVPDHG
ncbi:cytochrome P450 [Nocardioides endophyticus]|uniref:Cytochrome P450 n=1 Tax=Nocardioides endophyticus TaxID=1353775 RepID=A0ABP8ZCG2_9ACTN